MTRKEHFGSEQAAGPHFDVYVALPKGAHLEAIRDKAIHDVRIPREKVDEIVRALEKTPHVKIRSEVTREKADKAKLYFTQAGLLVSLVPVLTLEQMIAADGKVTCPACGERVTLNARNECGHCGAVVRPVKGGNGEVSAPAATNGAKGEAFDRDAMEAALRKQIRAELEREFDRRGRSVVLSRTTQVAMCTSVLVLMGLSFWAGQWRAELASKEALAELRKAYGGLDFDKMLAKLGPSSEGGTGKIDMEWWPSDPKDSLFATASLGPVIGESQADTRQVVGWLILGGLTHKQTVTDADAQVLLNGGPDGGARPADANRATLPAQNKLALGVEFARVLAEMGQLHRAREAIKLLSASPSVAADPGMAALLKQLELEVRARSMLTSPENLRRPLLESLRTNADAMPDPLARTMTLAQIAAILAESRGLPPEVSPAFVTLARGALAKVNNAGQRGRAMGAIQVAVGRALLAESLASAQAGVWARVRSISTDIGVLVDQAATKEAAILLLAMEMRSRTIGGLGSELSPRLVKALDLVEQESSILGRATLLRTLADVPGVTPHEKFQAVIARLDTAAEIQSGMLKARTLAVLALLYADTGDLAKFAAYRKRALETEGLSKPESVLMHAELVASGDIAIARQLHRAKAYAEAESRIGRIAGYLM